MKKYFSFKGTLSRMEFWQGFLGMCATGMGLSLINLTGKGGGLGFAATFIPMIAMLVILLPTWISMRFRDAGRSPYWAILCVFPPFMPFVLFAAILLPSTPRPAA